jgi:hypothetical protein
MGPVLLCSLNAEGNLINKGFEVSLKLQSTNSDEFTWMYLVMLHLIQINKLQDLFKQEV